MPLTSMFLFCVTVIGFGAAFSLTNIAVSSIPPLWVAAGRSLIALLVLGAFLVFRNHPINVNKTHIPAYLSVGFFTGIAPYILISWGQQFIPSSLGGVLFASSPLLTLLFGPLLFQVPYPGFSTLTGAIIGLGGVVLAFSSPADFSLQIFYGAAATIAAAACYAIGGLIIQRQSTTDMVAFTVFQLVPATIILIVIAWMISGIQFDETTTTSWIALSVLGVVGTSIPLVSLFVLVGREGAKSASLITFFIPFIALAIGVIFLDEAFSIKVLLGLVIALSGAFWIAKTS